MLSLNGFLNDLQRLRNMFIVAGHHEYKETDNINSYNRLWSRIGKSSVNETEVFEN